MEWPASDEPCHKKELQREFIFVMQAFGKIKVEVQKLVMPFMTVLRRRSLPAYDRLLALQEFTLLLISWISGAQWCIDSF